MLKISSKKQHIRFATLEQPHAWVVVAFLIETNGNETIAVSDPKVVKIIPKSQFALKAGNLSSFALSAPQEIVSTLSLQRSPYVVSLFGYSNSEVVIGLAAQPPTIK